MHLDDADIDRILTIVHLLARGADDKSLPPMLVNALNQNVEALIKYDSDPTTPHAATDTWLASRPHSE
jgi:hypothetical protein